MRLKIVSIISGIILVVSLLFEEFLWQTIWILQPILIVLMVLVCFVTMLISIYRKNRKMIIFHVILLVVCLSICLPRTELFKSKVILEATLDGDINCISLTLRENNTFEIIPMTWAGSFDSFEGEYKIVENKLIFLDDPYDNSFIPDTIYFHDNKLILRYNGDILDTTYSSYFEILNRE